jgi:PIN domain nuclease of toxin-antitoxin system
VPAIVIWESFLLHRLGRVELEPSPRRFFENMFKNPSYQPLDLTPEQAYLAGEFQPNAVPFDILICAAARSVELPLLTRDHEIEGSGVEVVW